MILLVAVDDRNGMTFNKRRQSQDAVLRQRILEISKDGKLWMNQYSAKLFPDVPQINISDDFLQEAELGDYCFVENLSCAAIEKWIEKVIVFKWNRKYPGDMFLDIDVHGGSWTLVSTEDFQGFSHEKITMEVYVR